MTNSWLTKASTTDQLFFCPIQAILSSMSQPSLLGSDTLLQSFNLIDGSQSAWDYVDYAHTEFGPKPRHPDFLCTAVNRLIILDLIEVTHTLEHYLPAFAILYGEDSPLLKSMEAGYLTNRKDISRALPMLGGLELPLEEDGSDDHAYESIRLFDWQGRHPDHSDKHMWLGKLVGAAEVKPREVPLALPFSALVEIRQELRSHSDV